MVATVGRQRVPLPRYRPHGREVRLTHELNRSVRHHEQNSKLFLGVFGIALMALGVVVSDLVGTATEDLVWFAGAVAVAALLLAYVHWSKARATRRKL